MIPVRNVYYMLSYAFRVLNEQGYKSIGTEEFHNMAEMCAAILIKGMAVQLKRGLGRDYIPKTESLSSPRGRIEVSESVKNLSIKKGQLVCSYDDFSVNSYMNRIIKSTLDLLLKARIEQARKKEIRKILVFMGDINVLDVHRINWQFQYNRNNQTYRLLISVCRLVIKGLLQTQSDGTEKIMDFFDEQKMHHLYEKFILEYYRKEFPQISAAASWMDWQVDDGFRDMLPKMETDITLQHGTRTLIIDAKYYERNLKEQYGKASLPTNNLYQIFTYVKNKEVELAGKEHERVAGMLLYAQTEEDGAFNLEYQMSGNPICVRTLDLSRDFAMIKEQLDQIATKYFDL